jgi:hypothetical protein
MLPLEPLDARLDMHFWLKLGSELCDLDLIDDDDLNRLNLSGCYVGDQPIPALAWLCEHGALTLYPQLTRSEAIAQLAAGCAAQVKRCASYAEATANELIALVNQYPSHATALNRLLEALTGYPSLQLFLADVAGQYLLPFPGTEPTVKHHSNTTAIHFELIGFDVEVLQAPWGEDIGQKQLNLRGGASTIEGTWDVLQQLLDETSNIFGAKVLPLPTGLPQGVMIQAGSEPLFFARYEYDIDTRTVGVYWEPVAPSLKSYLGGLELTQWIEQQYAKTNRPFNAESQLTRDLGL